MKRSYYLLSLAVTVAIGSLSCGPKELVKPDFVRASASQSDPRIVVIRTSDNPLYNGPIKWFIDTSVGEVTVFTFKTGTERALARSVNQIDPRLLFTLGAQATAFARGNLPDIPHVFAMVVKPTGDDVWAIVVVAAILAAGSVTFLRGVRETGAGEASAAA